VAAPRHSLVRTGLLVLLLALALSIGHGLLLMGHEDQAGHQVWQPADLAPWRATLPTSLRMAYWTTVIGAPIAWVAGAVILAIGLWHFQRRQ
jgi:hypothetical protein